VRWVVAHPGPSYSVHDTYVGWVEALRDHGEKVVGFNLDDRLAFYGQALKQVGENTFARFLTADQSYEMAINGLYSTLYQVRPDVLMVVSGFFLPHRLLDRARRSGTRIVILHTESPYEDERQMALAQYADVNLIDDPTNLESFRQIAASTWYCPKAYRPTVHHPGPPVAEFECDLAFVGTGFPSRVEFFEAMDLDGLDVMLAGNWPLDEDSPLYQHLAGAPEDCLDNEATADVYRSARVGLNLYRREAQRPELSAGYAMGPREVEMAACGAFFLRDPRPEGDEVLGMLPSFTSPAHASELLRYYLDRPDERVALAAKAREAVADRTFHNHAAELLRLLDT